MRISDWSSDVCSSDLPVDPPDELRNVLVVVAGEQRFSQRRRGERAMHADMRRSGCGEVILRPVQIDVLNLQSVHRGDDYRLLRSPGKLVGLHQQFALPDQRRIHPVPKKTYPACRTIGSEKTGVLKIAERQQAFEQDRSARDRKSNRM